MQVCDPPLMRAVKTENLQFAVRMCDYMDREGLRPNPETLQKLHEVTVSSMERDSTLPAAEMLGMVLEGWAENDFGLDSDDEEDEQLEDRGDEEHRRQAADMESGLGVSCSLFFVQDGREWHVCEQRAEGDENRSEGLHPYRLAGRRDAAHAGYLALLSISVRIALFLPGVISTCTAIQFLQQNE